MMGRQATYAVRVPGFHCWADHLRTWEDAKREQDLAQRTTGMRHSIFLMTAGKAVEVAK